MQSKSKRKSKKYLKSDKVKQDKSMHIIKVQ